MKLREAKLSQLANLVELPFVGNDIIINGLGLCNRHTQYSSILSYVTDRCFVHVALLNKSVKAIVVDNDVFDYLNTIGCSIPCIIADYPEQRFYDIHNKLFSSTVFYERFDYKTIVGKDCNIHRTAVLEDGVNIGNNVSIGANSVVNRGSIIGDNSYIGCCSVIGSEGFQVLRGADGTAYHVKHVGGTAIGCNVWLGDCVTVGNSMFEGQVVVGDNTKIDNHVHIAHNCILGDSNVLTAGAIMLGSSELKSNCWLAPGALVMNRIIVEDYGFVGINSAANKIVKKNTVVMGTPAVNIEEFTKNQFQIKRIIKKYSDK